MLNCLASVPLWRKVRCDVLTAFFSNWFADLKIWSRIHISNTDQDTAMQLDWSGSIFQIRIRIQQFKLFDPDLTDLDIAIQMN